MQLNATQVRLTKEEQKVVTQSVEALRFVETEESDVGSNPTDSALEDKLLYIESLTQLEEIELQQRIEDAENRYQEEQESKEKTTELRKQET